MDMEMQQTLQLIHSQTFFKILSCRYPQNPTKIKQNPNFSIPNHLSYPISSNPTKIKHFSHFATQKSNSHLTKNSPIISKLSLFISTFTDNDFSSKIPNHIPNIGGYHKTTCKTIKTVIALSYFYAKKQIKQRIYNQKLINQNNISIRKDEEI